MQTILPGDEEALRRAIVPEGTSHRVTPVDDDHSDGRFAVVLIFIPARRLASEHWLSADGAVARGRRRGELAQ